MENLKGLGVQEDGLNEEKINELVEELARILREAKNELDEKSKEKKEEINQYTIIIYLIQHTKNILIILLD